MGPPESPWQESFPPDAKPAQNIWVVTIRFLPTYMLAQVLRAMTGTSTLRRLVGEEELPEEVVPQPAVVRTVPDAGSEPDAGSTAYEMVELVGMEVASFMMATSPWYEALL